MNRTSSEPATVARFLALGDSYTIGEGVTPAERWPAQLAALLRERGASVSEPEIIARTGWTTDELRDALTRTPPVGPFDLVSLLIGVNDQYRGRSASDYRDQFRDLLSYATRRSSGVASHVVVLSIPDWSVTPFAEGRDRARIASEIDELNAIACEESARGGVRFVDITPISRRAKTDSTLLAGDGLHPSSAMYAEWASAVLPSALEALG